MNLVKWLRKNRAKAMVFVTIFTLVGFMGVGTYLQQASRRRMGQNRTMAYFAKGGEIKNYDLALARRELGTLKLLQADNMLRNLVVPIFNTPNLQSILLAELLFSDRAISPTLIRNVEQMIGSRPYRITEKQLNDIYRGSMPSEVYWMLLENESQRAGVGVSNEISRMELEAVIPQLFNGATYSQLIGTIVSREGVSEEEILTTFGKLIAILKYAEMICTTENITNAQIRHKASRQLESIDVEFVRFNSAVFAETDDEPDEEELVAHFDKYKGSFAGDVNSENPYGFGYKLHERAQLEYIAVELNDVSRIVTEPTQEEVEEFYQRHREEFTESVPLDPNDPNSPMTERIRSYGEVANIISKSLLQDRISSKAETILQEARTLTELGLEDMDTEAEVSTEQFKQMVGDYIAVAGQLSQKYKIDVYTGQTGLLSASDAATDKYLGTLFLESYGYPVLLVKIIFAVDGLEDGELGPFDIPKPRLYENIGPVKDTGGRIRAVVRVIETKKASEPESINQTFAKGSLEFGKDRQKAGGEVYSVRDKVVEDLKRLEAMDTAGDKAQEFIGLAKKRGWEKTVAKFNKLYGNSDEREKEDTDVFRLRNLTDVRRISNVELEALALQSKGDPVRRLLFNGIREENRLISWFFSIVPQDSNTIDDLPLAMEFKPGMSFYCLKNILVKRLEQEQYNKIKAAQIYTQDFIQSQSLAPVHFSPENILKRMNFRLAEEDKEPADVNTSPESNEGDL